MSLEEKLKTVKQLDVDILELTDDAKVKEEIDQAHLFKEGMYMAIVWIEKLLVATPTAPLTPITPRKGHTPNASGHCVKLPKLMLRRYHYLDLILDSYESAKCFTFRHC